MFDRETEAQRCLRIGNRLAEKGQHEQAAAWRELALQSAKGLDKTYDFFRL